MRKIEERIQQVKASLLIDQPYFGSIASAQKPKLNEDIQTFASTPLYFEYNDDYLEFLSDEELSFLLTNSAMHQALGYDNRKEGRQQWLWTMAQDYTINSLLVNNGLELPDGLLYDDRFDDLSSEAVYKILEDEIDEDKHTPKEVENITYEKMPDTNEYDQDPTDITDMHQQLLNKAKLQGDIPLGLEILIPELIEGKISWRDELYTVIENAVKFDYSLLPPNKRYISQGFALPALSGVKVKLIVAIDSSGSIDGDLLAIFLGEVESIMNSFENFEIDLLIADAKVHEHHILYPGDELNYSIKGGGGTNFEKTFKYVDENIDGVTLFLYFTDGLGTMPKDEPLYDVVWVMPKSDQDIPFGRKIILI
ncbi:MAG: VWA-like domain-containing protein [Campylobacterota bacterium]|nr:VWA-like domain-containing protein [Campylobacterota bacterium]